MQANHIKIQYPEEINEMEIVLKVNRTRQNIQKVTDLKEIVEKGKLLKVDIKQYRKKRSLDANSYCWILAQNIKIRVNSHGAISAKESYLNYK